MNDIRRKKLDALADIISTARDALKAIKNEEDADLGKMPLDANTMYCAQVLGLAVNSIDSCLVGIKSASSEVAI